MYTGLIYNDVFSKSLNLFGSHWFADYNTTTISENKELQLNPSTNYLMTPYPFGIDPVWQVNWSKKIKNKLKKKIEKVHSQITEKRMHFDF